MGEARRSATTLLMVRRNFCAGKGWGADGQSCGPGELQALCMLDTPPAARVLGISEAKAMWLLLSDC